MQEVQLEQIRTCVYKTPLGELQLGSYGDYLCLCDWRYRKMMSVIEKRLSRYFKADLAQGDSSVLQETRRQLDEYFARSRKQFDIPILTPGTEFQNKVWTELMEVPYGTTSTYLKLAEKIGNRNSVRAVAAANGANAISIIIPCHRIIGSNGTLVGYAGGLATKKRLLKLERNLFDL